MQNNRTQWKGKPKAEKKAEAPDWIDHDAKAEAMVLAALIRNNNLMQAYQAVLSDADFVVPLHKLIFAAMLRICGKGGSAKISTIKTDIETETGDIIARTEIEDIARAPLPEDGIDSHVQTLTTFRKRRAVVELAMEFATKGKSGGADIIDQFSKEVFGLSQKGGDQRTFVKMDTDARDCLSRIFEDDERGWGPTGIPTGFPDIDAAIGGLKPAKFYVIAAMEKAGKSSLGMAFLHSLLQQDIPTAFFSLEMRRDEVVGRLMMIESGVSIVNRPRGSRLSDDDKGKLITASETIERYPWYCSDLSDLTPGAITMACRHAKQQWGVEAIIIDYLQIIGSDDPKKDETRKRVEDASKAMRKMAKDLGVAVIGLAQLNRKPLDRVAGKSWRDFKPELGRPRRGDIRETAQIEMDADAILALYRPEILLKELEPIAPDDDEKNDFELMLRSMKNAVELGVMLNRSGPDGTRQSVVFEPAIMRFSAKRVEPRGGPLNTGYGNNMTASAMRR